MRGARRAPRRGATARPPGPRCAVRRPRPEPPRSTARRACHQSECTSGTAWPPRPRSGRRSGGCSRPSSGVRGAPKSTAIGAAAEAAAPARLGARASRCAPLGLGALGQHVAGAVQVDGHHRSARAPGQVGGARREGLGPAVGGAAAFGEDDQVPAVLDQLGGGVARPAVDLAPLDRDGGQGERPQHRLPGAVEEVVRRRRHDGAVAELDRQGGEQQRRVHVAGVVGGEDHRPLDVLEVLQPAHRGRARADVPAGRATLSITMARARRTG